MLKFFIYLTLLAIALFGGVYSGEQYHWFTYPPSYSREIIAFLGISIAIIFYFTYKRSQSSSFTQVYLLSICLKMLAYSAFILLIIFIDRSAAIGNVILFMVSYALFTALEVGFLFKAVNK